MSYRYKIFIKMKFVFVCVLIISILINIFATPVEEEKREKRSVVVFAAAARAVKKPVSDVIHANFAFLSLSVVNMWKNTVSSLYKLFNEEEENLIERKNITEIMPKNTTRLIPSFAALKSAVKRERRAIRTGLSNITGFFPNNSRLITSLIASEGVMKREKRAVGAVIGPILPIIGKFFGWGVAMSAAAAVGSATSVLIQDALNKKNAAESEEKLRRRAVDCTLNHVGCVEGFCYSNCGPRIRSADWCFTTKQLPANKSEEIKPELCKYDFECESCWPCASTCMMDGGLETLSTRAKI